ncbi:hypothetical protein CGJ66_23115 [Vibrio parahaemolyticus]|uniref:MBL fold metallo-hydrolase n=1 Tax=Vibrio parahaemolyticus TaxID=670 RepID=UPI0011227BF6|nr:MBL fold metallo-hydrolase [Vibrio parahaemolyticus]TOD30374.1 hypothetical protein CGJ66_23115 [Vibrio parahaemolyticus]
MESNRFIGILSNIQRVSEEPSEETEARYVSTVDGYKYISLVEQNSERLELFRLELFNPFCMYEMYYLLKPFRRFNQIPLQFEVIPCNKKDADIGIFSYFKNVSEEYRYYKIVSVRLVNLDEGDLLLDYFNVLRQSIKSKLESTWYEYAKKPAKYIGSKSIGLNVEPVGQGSMSIISDSNGMSKILLDSGHGTPINKKAVSKKTYKFNDNLSSVETVFLSHWDEDHYQLAHHEYFSYLKDKYWFVPFSKSAITTDSTRDAITYEPRLLVWETLVDITENSKFYIIDHGNKGSIPLGAGKNIYYECGRKEHASNERGLVLTIEQKSKKANHRVLVPGDADYEYFPSLYDFTYTGVIATHHGSNNLKSKDIPPPEKYDESMFILSFGFNDRYKHPSQAEINKAKRCRYAIWSTSLIDWHQKSIHGSSKLRIFNKHATSIKVI